MLRTNVCLCIFCFFFQAEDGIRDDLVTGVQTCALPISFIATTTAGPIRMTRPGALKRWCSRARRWCRQRRSKISKSFSRSEEHTSELQSPDHLVCRLLLEKKKKK